MARKILAVGTISIIMSILSAMPIYAHGNHHYNYNYANYPACSVAGCNAQGNHIHNGRYYCGHSYGYYNTYGHHCH